VVDPAAKELSPTGLSYFRRRVKYFWRLPNRSKRVFVQSLVLNPLFRASVHRRGIKHAAEMAKRLGGTRQPLHRDPVPVATDVVRGVVAAAGALPIELVCLPRSLTSWTLLRRMGIGSELLIGMDSSKEHRTAHAWVRVNGVDVGEDFEHIARLAVFDAPILGASSP
jgi:hypothetical protein